MGPRRQLVGGRLEDNPEGSTTSISAVAAVSTQRISRRRSQSEEGERQGSRPSICCKGSGNKQGSNTVRQAGHPDVVRKSPSSSLNPDEQVAAAQIRVTKLEAAIQAVGENDPAAMGLKEALQKARVQAQLRAVQDRMSHTEACLNRSQKRLETVMSEARKLREDITELESKIQDGERRLEGLRAEASVQPSPFVIATDPQERSVSFAQGLQKWKPMVPGMGHRSDRKRWPVRLSSWRLWTQQHEVGL